MMGKYTHEHMSPRRHHKVQQGVWQFRKEKPQMDRLTARRFNCRKEVWCCHHETPQELRRTKKKKTLLALTLLGLSLSLTGCMGIYEGGFECPPGEGTKCKSISEVNDLVNKGEIPKKASSLSSEEECTPCHSSLDNNKDDQLQPVQPIEAPAIWWAPDANQNPVINYQHDPEAQKNLGKKQEIQRNDKTSI